MKPEMRVLLERLEFKKLTLDEFVRRSRPYWKQHAVKLVSRWRPPPHVGWQDVEQELLRGFWQGWQSFSYQHGVDFSVYTVTRAMHEGLRYIHQHRKALRRDGRNPSRYEMAEATLRRAGGGDDDELPGVIEAAAGPDRTPDIDSAVDLRARLDRAIDAAADDRVRIALTALRAARFDAELAARLIHDHPEARKRLAIHKLKPALDYVVEQARQL